MRLLRGPLASYVNRADTAGLLAAALEQPPASAAPPDRPVVNAWCCLGAFLASRYETDEVRRCVDFAGHAASCLGDTETAISLRPRPPGRDSSG